MENLKPRKEPRLKASAKSLILAVLIVVAILVWITMLAWNNLVPAAFGGPELTFFQALLLWLFPNLIHHGFSIVKWVAR